MPPPPTAKPIRVSSGVIKRRKSEETIFLDKQLSKDIAPRTRSKYENLPEKPRHSARFIIKENVKDPVSIVSLKNEVLKSESNKNNIDEQVSRIASVPNAAIEVKVDPSTSNISQISLQRRSASFPENEQPSRRSKIDVATKPLLRLNKAESDNRENRPAVAVRPKSTFAGVSKPKIPTKPLPVLEKVSDLSERPIIPGKPVKEFKEDGPTGAAAKLASESTAKSKPVVPVGPGLIINKDDILAKKQMLGKSVEVKDGLDKADKKGKSSETGIEKKVPPRRPETPSHANIESKEDVSEIRGCTKPLPAKRQISIEHSSVISDSKSAKVVVSTRPPKPAMRAEISTEQSPVDNDLKSAKEAISTRPPKPAVRQQSTDTAMLDMKCAKQTAKPDITATRKPQLPNIKPNVSIDIVRPHSTDFEESKVQEMGIGTVSSDTKSPGIPPAKPKLPVKPSLSTQTTVEEKILANKPIPAKRTDSQSGVTATEKPKPEGFSSKSECKETPVPVPRVKLAKSRDRSDVKQEFEVALTRSPSGAKEKPERPELPNLTKSPKMEKPIRPVPPNLTVSPRMEKPNRPPPPHLTDSPKLEKPERPAPPHVKDYPITEKPERPTPPHLKDSSSMEKPERPTPPHLKDSPKPASPQSRTKDKTKLRKVIKEYSRTSSMELNLTVGDMLFELDEARAQGKCFGLLENGQEGWYPVDHVERVYPDS